MPADPAREPGTPRVLTPGVSRIVGQKNVGESYEHIARSITHRINRHNTPEQKADPGFPRLKSRAITDAMIAHHNNREVYEHVMGRPAEFALPSNRDPMRHHARETLTGSSNTQDEMSNDEWMRSMMNKFGPGPEGNF